MLYCCGKLIHNARLKLKCKDKIKTKTFCRTFSCFAQCFCGFFALGQSIHTLWNLYYLYPDSRAEKRCPRGGVHLTSQTFITWPWQFTVHKANHTQSCSTLQPCPAALKPKLSCFCSLLCLLCLWCSFLGRFHMEWLLSFLDFWYKQCGQIWTRAVAAGRLLFSSFALSSLCCGQKPGSAAFSSRQLETWHVSCTFLTFLYAFPALTGV